MRILALGGIAGPVLFTTVVVLAAALRPGYSHYEAVISALGETGGPHALLMNAGGFVPTGFLLIGFALSLSRLVPRTALATAGAVCSGLLGAGIVGAGVFSCDLGCRGLGTSREAFLHTSPPFSPFPLESWRVRSGASRFDRFPRGVPSLLFP